jgi:transcription initiation factor TFIIH subunit 4
MLPHLAKTIVMAMLYMPNPFHVTELDAWFRLEAKKEREKALSVLEQLHILVHKVDASRNSTYELYKSFAKSLRQALEGSGTHRSFGVPASESAKDKVSIAFLDEYARKQWENILFYMVGSTVGLSSSGALGQDIGNGTKELLKMGEFVKVYNSRVSITRQGFTFVLQETNAQVWSLLIVYLRNSPALGTSNVGQGSGNGQSRWCLSWRPA